jgi:8-oxo-dGTP diphosphatase
MHHPQQIVCVAGLFWNSMGEVLLVRTPRRGWETPGGQVEQGEDLIAALERETVEESGCEVDAETLVGVYSRLTPPEMVVFMFRGRHRCGTPRGSHETLEAGWFPTDEAVIRVTHPASAMRLRDALAGHDRPVYRAYAGGPFALLKEWTL